MIPGTKKNFYNMIFEEKRKPLKYNNSHWSVAWSDLMMTMFILFAVMYMYLSANSTLDFGNGPGRANISDSGSSELLNTDSTELIEKNFPEIYDLKLEKLKNIVNVELANDRAVRIILKNDLLFNPGSADLTREAYKALNKISTAIRRTPYLVNISGHSDDVPFKSVKYPSNWELSSARACSVVRFFTDIAGIPARRFFVSGYSYFDPISTNDTKEGRAANRRVEILITKDGNYYE